MLCSMAEAAEPLRVFIRAGEKTHAPGTHDYPRFLKEWKPMLEARGLEVDGALAFPTKKQLESTDVLILHSKESGNIEIGTERKNLDAFLARGGGLVVIHGGAVSRDPDYYKSIIGGSWRFGITKWLEGPMSLYFTDRENPITRSISNFDLEDEIYYDMDLLPEVSVLAAAYTPKAIGSSKDSEAAAQPDMVNVYDIQPQIWTCERTVNGGREPYRAFVHIPGHWYENFSHNGVRTMLLRGIAWAGKREDVDAFCKQEELGEALRYVDGGAPKPAVLSKELEVHPEFEISLVASEPLINNPMNINWDEKGRLWVVESPEYPNGLREANVAAWMDSGSANPGVYRRDPLDRISMLTDSDGDGVMDRKKVFADKLELVTSMVFYRDGVIASSAPDIWYLRDTDGDEVADERTKLYTNLGTRDTHAVINNMRWGRDGWIYAAHGYSSTDNVTSGDGNVPFSAIGSGVVRFKPDGSAFEQFASKGGNTWGLETTLEGEVFFTQPTTGNPLVQVVLPEYILAQGKLPGVSSTHGLLPGAATVPAMRWEQQAYVQIDQVGRYTAGAGTVIYEGGAWPAKWNHSYFTTEPTVNIVGHFNLKPSGVTYTAAKEASRKETEFIRSKNLWFRPIEVRTGPDGALYVVDFCNQAIIHNDTRGPIHGPANAAVRPDRDHYYGRLWRVQHREAKALPTLSLDRSDRNGLEKAASSPNKHTRETAQRLLREDHGLKGKIVGSSAVKLFQRASQFDEPASVIDLVAEASDPWTLSALVAASSDRAPEMIQAALTSKPIEPILEFCEALAPQALWNEDGTNNAAELLSACASTPSESAPIIDKVLAGLADPNLRPPSFTPAIKDKLGVLLESPNASARTLSLIGRWDKDHSMAEVTKGLTEKLISKLMNSGSSDAERTTAARGLIPFHKHHDEILPAFKEVLAGTNALALKRDLIAVLGGVDDPTNGAMIVDGFAALPSELQGVAFDQIVRRPSRSIRMLNLLEKAEIDPAVLNPGNLARLRNHPAKGVARRAKAVLDRLSPASLAKSKLIADLIPEVEKAGDPAKGKLLYGACAICHKLGDVGIEVGPALDGMGAHGPRELLAHIIDPNREVEQSYWAHYITTNQGEVFAGVITSENTASVTLATQAGEKEISKDQIAKRENTKRSLMPEGFEALGAEGLRDLLAYIVGEAAQDYRIIDLSEAYTADSRSGLFQSDEPDGGCLQLPQAGNLTVGGVPFYVQHAEKSPAGNNLIVLKGGPNPSVYSKTHPQSVSIDVGVAAERLHFLGGIGGWAFPAGGGENVPVLKAEVLYEGGTSEVFTLTNGVEFADYLGGVNVPGSAQVEALSSGATQVRWLTLELEGRSEIEKLILSSHDNQVAPVIVSITADLQGKARAPKGKATAKAPDNSIPIPLPATPVNWEKGKTRVLLIGGGTSHDFKRFFGDTDSTTLTEAGFTVHYTEDRAQATELLARADVAIVSVNRAFFDTVKYREAFMKRLALGKGVIMLHPGTWYGYEGWPELNAKVVGGGARGHDKLGPFQVEVVRAKHPIMVGVPASFDIIDELYYVNAEGVTEGTSPITVLARTSPSQKYGNPHPSVWITAHERARLVGIALGHDERCHEHEAYKQILTNAATWISSHR